MSDQVENQENNQDGLSKESKKILNNFNNAMTALTAIFNGEENIKPTTKVSSNRISALMEEVVAEEVEEIEVKFKAGVKKLTKAKVAYDRAFEQAKKDFQKAHDEKMKAFTNEANQLLGLVDNMKQIRDDYTATLRAGDNSQ